jgi:hypothetical protein
MSARRPFSELRRGESVFVESGSYLGDGIQDALDAGFERVISFEVAPGLYEKARLRFLNDPRVTVHHAPSQSMKLDDIKDRAFFWLDGHFSTPETGYHRTLCPVLEELDVIARHPIKTHTILIDDVRLFGTREFMGITIHDVQDVIRRINPNYVFTFANGHVANDILVARVL